MAKHIVIAPQAFKGSLPAIEVAQAIEAGILASWSGSIPPQCTLVPLADGGEGTATVVCHAAGSLGKLVPVQVRGPLPQQHVTAQIGWIADGYPTAIIESAQAIGLPLVAMDQRNPLLTSTLGVGDMIRHALDMGAQRLYIGLGGSSTNDGGMGMAAALGVRFRGQDGTELTPCGAALAAITTIDYDQIDPRLATVTMIGMTDVTNPLYGSEGATIMYGPQKGADSTAIATLEAGLRHYAVTIASTMNRNVATVAGGGAAGGLGAGLLAFGPPQTRLEGGAKLILAATHFADHLLTADLVITGEGRCDEQGQYGKLTTIVAAQAHAAGVPVICVTGSVGTIYATTPPQGIDAIIIATDGPHTLPEAMEQATQLITGAVARAIFGWQHVSSTIFS